MGLCKCPKKKVTNQFCFEHRVNVCEYCMVSNHSKCVVQSYLQWLSDSEYDSTCHLCKLELAEGECIRLTCYHVLHQECLNNYAGNLISTTSLSSYTCPVCDVCIFPSPNAVSPVADSLKVILNDMDWARRLLQVSTKGEEFPKGQSSVKSNQSPMRSSNSLLFDKKSKPTSVNETSATQSNTQGKSRPEPYGASYSAPYTSTCKLYDATEHGLLKPTVFDYDEDKYKRRSAIEWFSRWFKSKSTYGRNRRKDLNIIYKRWVVIILLCLLALCTLCILFLRLGRATADSDPLLDPHLNPNIRIEESADEVQPLLSDKHEPNLVNKNSIQGKVKDLLPA